MSYPDCPYILKYTALRTWDIVPYLWYAKLWITDSNHNLIAQGEFKLINKGGLALTKFQGTKEKIDPLVDRLLNRARY